MGLFQGLAGNLTEISKEEVEKQYGSYLLKNEDIEVGYKLLRDAVVITNKRILDFDSQGATGKKTRVNSIRLNAIVEVTAETAGSGLDDSEISISYISSPNHTGNTVTVSVKKLEFPKSFDIAPLYRKFEELAHENVDRINGN